MNEREVKFDLIREVLKDEFNFSSIDAIEPLPSLFRSKNFAVIADSKKYFLKEYHTLLSYDVHPISYSRRTFAEKESSVILPKQDRYGRDMFRTDVWCSLFPFIDQHTPTADDLSEPYLHQLGALTARMHLIGKDQDLKPYYPMKLWHKERFEWEVVELERAMERRALSDPVDRDVKEILKLKQAFIEREYVAAKDIDLPFDHLLHGDMIYQNTFTDEQMNITHLYDFEKTCIGPRAFEIARGIMINCFDDGWDERNFNLARAYLKGYTEIYPISKEDIAKGILMFQMHFSHLTWFYVSYVLMMEHKPTTMYESHLRRVKHLFDDRNEFIDAIYPKN